MKLALLGSTALVAAGLVAAGNVQAAEPIVKLSTSGIARAAYGSNFDTFDRDGVADTMGADRAETILKDFELRFNLEGTADNGLTYGGIIELEGDTEDDQMDQTWLYVSGGFGEFRVGSTDDAAGEFCQYAPSAGFFGADSPTFSFLGAMPTAGALGTNATCPQVTGEAAKLAYFSPTFGGFSFGVSYTPDGNTHTGISGEDSESSDVEAPFEYSETVSIGAGFNTDFGGVSVAAGAGYTWVGDVEGDGIAVDMSSIDKRDDINASLVLGFGLGDGMLSIGGAARWSSAVLVDTSVGGVAVAIDDDLDEEVYSAGIAYGIDAWAVGLSASLGDYDAGDREYLVIVGAASYDLAPGVQVSAGVEYGDEDAGGVDADSFAAGTAIGINF